MRVAWNLRRTERCCTRRCLGKYCRKRSVGGNGRGRSAYNSKANVVVTGFFGPTRRRSGLLGGGPLRLARITRFGHVVSCGLYPGSSGTIPGAIFFGMCSVREPAFRPTMPCGKPARQREIAVAGGQRGG